MIRLMIRHQPLAAALRITLQSYLKTEMDDGGLVTPGDVVVTTTMDASPDECRAVTEKGALVVVLTPHHTCSEASKYFAAGAAHYVEMTASVSALTVAVQAAMRKGQALALGAG